MMKALQAVDAVGRDCSLTHIPACGHRIRFAVEEDLSR